MSGQLRHPRSFRRTLVAALGAVAVTASTIGSASPAAAAVALPDRISAVSIASTRAGTFTVHWAQAGHNTTGFQIETGLDPFSKTNASMPVTGRHAHVFAIAASARSFTFSASQLAAAGAPFGSGNEIYFRLSAVNRVGTVSQLRPYGYLQAGIPKAPVYAGAGVKFATYNVLTATAGAPARPWYTRLPDVAKGIIAYHPGVVALQELNIGRADGKSGWNNGTPRQDDSLLTELTALGAGRYRLVRDTAYTNPDDHVGTQGERILYDSSRFTLGSACPNTTGSHAYNGSCSIRLPIRANDPSTVTRFAGYAWFTDRSTGQRFYFVSVHLDSRHTGTAADQISFDKLRQAQMTTVLRFIDKINIHHVKVVIAGDMNSWQNDRYGDSAHDSLVAAGYTDSYTATSVVRGQYPTFTGNAVTVKPGVNNFATRLDKIMTKGFHGASQWNNVLRVTDAARASDHNLVTSDLVY